MPFLKRLKHFLYRLIVMWILHWRGMGTAETTFMMVFKLLECAQKRWQRVFGYALITFVLEGRVFKDGLEVKEAA